MLRRARHRIRRGISRVDLWLGLRLALVAVASMVVGRLLGLSAFVWAGISAIVVCTGTPGGSFSASLARVGGTVTGLATGLLTVLALGHSLLAAAVAIPLAIALTQGLGLKAAVKVAALTTLFPVLGVTAADGLGATWATSFSRAGNVLLGCGVTLLVDGLLWPERSAVKLQARLRRDVGRVGALASGLLEAYVERRACPSEALLPELQGGRPVYAELLKELGSEPEDPEAPRNRLALQVEALHLLTDHCAALRDIQRQTAEDEAQDLLKAEVSGLSAALRAAGEAFGGPAFPGGLDDLRGAWQRLEATYEGVRGDRGTQAFPRNEVFRLLGVLYLCGALVRGFEALHPAPEAPEGAEG